VIKLKSAAEFRYDVISIREESYRSGGYCVPHKRALNGGYMKHKKYSIEKIDLQSSKLNVLRFGSL